MYTIGSERVCTDIKRAFDSVHLSILMKKLENNSIFWQMLNIGLVHT